MRHKHIDLEPMEESVVKRIAHIVGDASAAKAAIDRAAEIRARGNEAKFWNDRGNGYIVVQEVEPGSD